MLTYFRFTCFLKLQLYKAPVRHITKVVMPTIIIVAMAIAYIRWSTPKVNSGNNRGNREDFGKFPLKGVCMLII